MRKVFTLLALIPIAALQSGTTPEKENDLHKELKRMTATILAEHNACRQASSSSLADLKWDDKLAAYAQEYANELMKEPVRLKHSTHGERAAISGWEEQWIGENLGYGMNTAWKLNTNEDDLHAAFRQSIQSWCSEKQYYNRSNNSCQAGQSCGHYTQVVWAETKSVGCGIAVSKDGTKYVLVCNYGPGGNISGYTPFGGKRPNTKN